MNQTDFASLLSSRLCHDLISPVGALSSGLELLQDEQDPDMRAQCLDLLSVSANQIVNRLKFFRIAFGAGAGLSDGIDVREIRAALEGWFHAGKVQIEWMFGVDMLSKTAAKLLLNIAMLAGEALLRGGTLKVAAERDQGALELAVRAEGLRLRLNEDAQRLLTNALSSQAIEPRVAPALLVRLLSDEIGAQLSVAEPEAGVLVIAVRLPASPQV